MAPYPTLRQFWRRPLYRAFLFALLLAALAAGYVNWRGGWANMLLLAPTLDASTPKTQNGFTLIDIQRPGEIYDQFGRTSAGFQYQKAVYQTSFDVNTQDTADAFGAWIQPPSLPNSLLSGSVDSFRSTFGKAFSVTSRMSDGETLPLEWHLSDERWQSGLQRLLFVNFPSGYSDTCRFADITIADQNGHNAQWRITNLPRMRHAVPPPRTFTNTVTQNGITMSAQAWHEGLQQSNGEITGEVAYILHPILPPNSHQWDLVTTGVWQEWEPYNYDGQLKLYAYSGTPVLSRNGVFNTGFERWYGGGIRNIAGVYSYPKTNHCLRLTCELRQFETYDEKVTFHNVAVGYDADEYRQLHEKTYFLMLPKPLSITTPSGVTVTLPAQDGRSRPLLVSNALNFWATVQPMIQSQPVTYSLPNSPLARTFGKSVQISLSFPAPYRFGGGSDEANDRPASISMSLAENPVWHPTPNGVSSVPFYRDLPPVLKDFTLIIHQRVDLQTIPMIFTLPIRETAPPYYPKDWKGPKFR